MRFPWLALCCALGSTAARAQARSAPDTVIVRSGNLQLRALFWRPAGPGPFPAVLFNHGNGPADNPLKPQRSTLGPLFVRHGYAFLQLFRRGVGLSIGQGVNSFDQMHLAIARGGQAAWNTEQLRLTDNDDFDDIVAALSFLRAHRLVDANRVAVVGHSFGGSLTMILAERDSAIRAAVMFGPAAGSWDPSPALRARLRQAARTAPAPLFLAFAANDYSVAPGRELDAERARHDKPHQLKVYPAVGRSAEEGHDLVYLRSVLWERDVFSFLDSLMKR